MIFLQGFMDKIINPIVGLLSQLCRQALQNMSTAGIKPQFRLVATGYPLGMHENRIVQKRIQCPDCKKGWRHALQVCIEGGYVRICVFVAWGVGLVTIFHGWGCEH